MVCFGLCGHVDGGIYHSHLNDMKSTLGSAMVQASKHGGQSGDSCPFPNLGKLRRIQRWPNSIWYLNEVNQSTTELLGWCVDYTNMPILSLLTYATKDAPGVTFFETWNGHAPGRCLSLQWLLLSFWVPHVGLLSVPRKTYLEGQTAWNTMAKRLNQSDQEAESEPESYFSSLSPRLPAGWETWDQWEFQDPKLEVPTVCKAYVRLM